MVDRIRIKSDSKGKGLNPASSTCLKCSGECHKQGFTLIEMMVVIAIIGILSSIAIGSWGALRESNKVEAAAESLRSVLTAARLRAVSTGKAQQVTVNFVVNGAAPADSINSTLRGAGLLAGNLVVGNERTFDTGVDWINGAAGCIPSLAADTFKTIQFNSRGTVQTLPALKTRTLIVQDTQAGNRFCLTVNSVTGRVRMQRL